MESSGKQSVYGECRILLTTKHGKQEAIGPAFHELLSADVEVFEFDTDSLGTFSGEIARIGTAQDCVRRKCELGMKQLNAEFGLASEGSFGPHPSIPFIPCDYELLCFMDSGRNLCLYESILSTNTNYRTQSLDSMNDLLQFGSNALFPSHSLILRPNEWRDRSIVFKDIHSTEDLSIAFEECRRNSSDGRVWVETDMRAHRNPTRMSVIKDVAVKLCRRLLASCPACQAPGWGTTGTEKGLPCEYCHSPTEMISSEIRSCSACGHSENAKRSDGLTFASARYCGRCNP